MKKVSIASSELDTAIPSKPDQQQQHKKRSLFDAARKSRKDLLLVSPNPSSLQDLVAKRPTTPPTAPIDAAQKRREHRAKVVQEILSSETVFHQLLVDFITCFYHTLQMETHQVSMDFMSRPTLVVLCTHLEQLSLVSGQLLVDLTRQVDLAKQNLSQTNIGNVFLQTSNLLKLFGQYAEHHSNARMDIALMMESKEFRQFWERAERSADAAAPTTNADFASYLILPIQRVPRYLLLLRALLEVTATESADFDPLTRAVDELANAAKYMNECIVRAEQKEELRVLQSKFVGTPVDFLTGFGPAGFRALEMQGLLVRITSKNVHKQYHFHLMNDALVYSRVVRDGFRFHRALPITGTQSCSVLNVEDGLLCQNAAYLAYTALEPYSRTRSCAFQVRTKEKSFIVYAANLELKDKWIESLQRVIAKQTELEQNMPAAIAERRISFVPTAAATTSSSCCQMCQATLYHVFAKRVCCERCNLVVCGACAGNFRLLPNGKIKATAKLPALPPVCVACAWEMDGTALDDSPTEFRMKLWVEDVQSLGRGNSGSCVAKPHKDAAEAMKRLYFSLSFKTHNEDAEQRRGPSNVGALGPDCAFSIPLGLPSDEHLPAVTLYLYMLGVGEIGAVPIPLELVVCEEELARAQPFFLWHVVVAEETNPNAVRTLALTLAAAAAQQLQEPPTPQSQQRVALKIRFELQVPPALWHAQQQQQQQRRRSSSVSMTRPGASKLKQTSSEIASRLQRFMAIDDAQYAVGGGIAQVEQDENMREKLNVHLLGEYETQVLAHPSKWAVCLLDILYSDCLKHFGALAKKRADLYSDTQLTLLNRLSAFHKQNANVLQQYSAASHLAAAANIVTTRTDVATQESSNETATRHALRGLRSDQTDLFDENERKQVVQDLLASEEAYCRSLQVLDDVFVARLLAEREPTAMQRGSYNANNKPFTSPLKFKPSTAAATSEERGIVKQLHVLAWLRNVHEIRVANHDFLTTLQQQEDEDCIGNVFERFSSIAPVYSLFARGLAQAMQEINSDRALVSLLQACEADARQTFAEMLNLPLVRVEQYTNALSSLLMIVKPSHEEDWNALRTALGRLLETTQHIQRALRRTANAQRLHEIESQVDDWPAGFVLNPPQHQERWLVREGWLQLAAAGGERMRYVWLFSDCICFATSISKRHKTMHKLKQVGQDLLFGETHANNKPKLRFRFQQMFWLKQQGITVCDMPAGVTMSGYETVGFSLNTTTSDSAQQGSLACVLNVPMDFEYCTSKRGPAAVEQASAKHKLGNGERRVEANQGDRAHIKALWLSDVTICIEMCNLGLMFEDDDNDLVKRERMASMCAASISLRHSLSHNNSGKRFSTKTSLNSVDCDAQEIMEDFDVDRRTNSIVQSLPRSSVDDDDMQTDKDNDDNDAMEPRDSLTSYDVQSVYKYSVTSLDDGALAVRNRRSAMAVPITPLRKVSFAATSQQEQEEEHEDVNSITQEEMDFEML